MSGRRGGAVTYVQRVESLVGPLVASDGEHRGPRGLRDNLAAERAASSSLRSVRTGPGSG